MSMRDMSAFKVGDKVRVPDGRVGVISKRFWTVGHYRMEGWGDETFHHSELQHVLESEERERVVTRDY